MKVRTAYDGKQRIFSAQQREKWEVQRKKRNVKRTIIKIIGFLLIAFFILVLLGILLFAYYAWKAPAFNESKLQDPKPAEIYDRNGELVKN